MSRSNMPGRGEPPVKPGYSRKQFRFGTSFVEIYFHKGKSTWAGELYWLRADTGKADWVQVFAVSHRKLPGLLRVARAEKENEAVKRVNNRVFKPEPIRLSQWGF